MDQQHKNAKFRALHQRAGIFIIANPWDVGTARILASAGFEALATTSTGMAFSLGISDGDVTREQTLAHCRRIVEATELPVSADLENGFGDSPEQVAHTIADAAAIGLAGCSIEDHTKRPDDPIFDFNLAVERIEAAVQAKRSLPYDFMLTARCENFLWGRPDVDDTIKRLQAFEKAGADVLYAPGLGDLKTIQTICESVTVPVNVVIESLDSGIGLSELAEAGIKHVSVGSALVLAGLGAVMKAADEMIHHGTFSFCSQNADFFKIQSLFAEFKK